MKEQTSIEWFIEQLLECNLIEKNGKTLKLIGQAKAMEKEQIVNAISKGWDYYEDGKVRWIGEQYYNETFKQE